MDDATIKQSWTRLLEGDRLSSDEQLSLMDLLCDAHEPIAAVIRDDLQIHQTLQALYAEDELRDDQTEDFARRLIAKIDSQHSHPTELPELAVKPISWKAPVAAIAACILVVVTGVIWALTNTDADLASNKNELESVASAEGKPSTSSAPNPPKISESDVAESSGNSQTPESSTPAGSQFTDSSARAPNPTPILAAEQPKIQADPVTPTRNGIRLSPPHKESYDHELVKVKASQNAVWAEGSDPTNAKNAAVELLSGIAQLQLMDGAEIRMRGPTKLKVSGANAAELFDGSVSARIPVSAHGFQLTAPGVGIVDLGTEFSVTSEKKSRFTMVEVTEGEVQATQKPLVRRGRERTHNIIAGQSKWFPVDNSEAYDWVLRLTFGPKEDTSEKVVINDTEFDLSIKQDRKDSKELLKKQVRLASVRHAKSGPGNRFRGLVILDGNDQVIRSQRDMNSVWTLTFKLTSRANAWEFKQVSSMR